jgi:hydrogenase nickel incorporation protein HypB
MRLMDGLVDNKKKTKNIEVEQDFLKEQKRLAAENRQLLYSNGIKMIDIMGSVGTGKTSLVEQLIILLKGRYRIAVFNGDLATSIDRDRIMKIGVPAVQINTGKECHIDAALVRKSLEEINLEATDLIIVENVGNLICPVDFPLGSHLRMLVISVTEGPYIALKHPYIFAEMVHVVINKIDLEPFLGVNLSQLAEDIKSINAAAKINKVSCKTGEGLNELIMELRGTLEDA